MHRPNTTRRVRRVLEAASATRYHDGHMRGMLPPSLYEGRIVTYFLSFQPQIRNAMLPSPDSCDGFLIWRTLSLVIRSHPPKTERAHTPPDYGFPSTQRTPSIQPRRCVCCDTPAHPSKALDADPVGEVRPHRFILRRLSALVRLRTTASPFLLLNGRIGPCTGPDHFAMFHHPPLPDPAHTSRPCGGA